MERFNRIYSSFSNNPKGRVPRALPVGEWKVARRASSEARKGKGATGYARGDSTPFAQPWVTARRPLAGLTIFSLILVLAFSGPQPAWAQERDQRSSLQHVESSKSSLESHQFALRALAAVEQQMQNKAAVLNGEYLVPVMKIPSPSLDGPKTKVNTTARKDGKITVSMSGDIKNWNSEYKLEATLISYLGTKGTKTVVLQKKETKTIEVKKDGRFLISLPSNALVVPKGVNAFFRISIVDPKGNKVSTLERDIPKVGTDKPPTKNPATPPMTPPMKNPPSAPPIVSSTGDVLLSAQESAFPDYQFVMRRKTDGQRISKWVKLQDGVNRIDGVPITLDTKPPEIPASSVGITFDPMDPHGFMTIRWNTIDPATKKPESTHGNYVRIYSSPTSSMIFYDPKDGTDQHRVDIASSLIPQGTQLTLGMGSYDPAGNPVEITRTVQNVPTARPVDPATKDLLTIQSLISGQTYLGSFKLPRTFDYGAEAMAYLPPKDGVGEGTLVVSGKATNSVQPGKNVVHVAIVNIPQLDKSGNIKNLQTAVQQTGFVDIAAGVSNLPSDHNLRAVQMSVDPENPDEILVGWSQFYPANGSHSIHSSLVRISSADLKPLGPSVVLDDKGLGQGFTGGFVAHLSPEAQRLLGGNVNYVAGFAAGALNIISAHSQGPFAAFAFDSGNLKNPGVVPTTALAYNDPSHQFGPWNQASPEYNGATQVIAEISIGRTFLSIGSNGAGPFFYDGGAGTRDPYEIPGWSSSGSHGTHTAAPPTIPGYPYNPKIWLYDVNDLVAVKAGQKNPWDVRPYATGEFTLPFQSTNRRQIVSSAYDEKTGRLFVTELAGSSGLPVVNVYQVNPPQNGTTVA